MELWNRICMGLLDPLLGWLLALSWTATLAVVALGTGLILTLVRKVSTDQDLLRRGAEDKKQVAKLLREARGGRDRETVRRLKMLKATIAQRTMGQELKPLLLAIVPVAILATWCYARLEFHPPKAGEPTGVMLCAPVSAAGKTAHLVPVSGLQATPGWLVEAQITTVEGAPAAVAQWKLAGAARHDPYRLTFVLDGRTYARELLIGRPAYSPPLELYDEGQVAIRHVLPQARLFGKVGGLGVTFPPWLVAYLLIVVPGALVIKKTLRVW